MTTPSRFHRALLGLTLSAATGLLLAVACPSSNEQVAASTTAGAAGNAGVGGVAGSAGSSPSGGAGAGGVGGPNTPFGGAGGIDAGAVGDASMAGSAGSGGDAGKAGAAGDGSCPPMAYPPNVPSSWKEDSSFSCDCRFFYSQDPSTIEPIVWEPCVIDTIPAASSWDCRQMKMNFPPSNGRFALNGVRIDHSTGSPRLAFRREYDRGDTGYSGTMLLAGSLDGQPEKMVAATSAENANCRLDGYATLPSIEYGGFHFILNNSSPYRTAVYDWSTTADPIKLVDDKSWMIDTKGAPDGYSLLFVSPTLHVSVTKPGVEPFIISKPVVYDGLSGGVPKVGKDVVFLERRSTPTAAVYAWVPGKPLTPVLTAKDLSKEGFLYFGTDGVDAVWTHGMLDDKPLKAGYPFPIRELYTAKVLPGGELSNIRRLRSDPSLSNLPSVGCGYAVKKLSTNSSLNGSLLLVRLSDGVSWIIPATSADDYPLGQRWQWMNEMGVTCDEVFWGGTSPHRQENGIPMSTIFRVKIASLGPGTAPD